MQHRRAAATLEARGVPTEAKEAFLAWFDEGSGKVFCLVEAPSKEAAEAVHREAHGLVADEITEVKEGA
jgi:Protein of unknown function (DUF4242)